MTTVRLKENEPFEVALRRFKRTVEKTGLLTELRAREFYEKPTSERKRKLAAAVKRHYKRLRSQMLPPKLYESATTESLRGAAGKLAAPLLFLSPSYRSHRLYCPHCPHRPHRYGEPL